ncbi:MAG: phosphate acyltransferase, partial [Candidatus Omnitrophota bacterium]
MDFIAELRERAKKNPKTIILPEGHDSRVIAAAGQIQQEGLAKVILMGDAETVRQKAQDQKVSLDGITILEHKKDKDFKEYVNLFYELRKHKGMTPEDAEKLITEKSLFYAALMVRKGAADSFVAGAVNTSGDVARAAIYCVGIDRKAGTLSSSFIMQLENSPYGEKGLFIFADCGIVPDPSPSQLAGIAFSSAQLFEALFEKEARVALLSFSSKG